MSRTASRDRFREAQASPGAGFDAALREIRSGHKTGHWIWYVLPQISGLGTSSMSRTFAIRDVDEAADYLRDGELGARLATIVTAIAEQLDARPGLRLSSLRGSEIDAIKVDAARAVLAAAGAQGYPPCALTLTRLNEARRSE
jgi:uncharacterized protein (DUF1810 family)